MSQCFKDQAMLHLYEMDEAAAALGREGLFLGRERQQRV